jgi:hypothetical protein
MQLGIAHKSNRQCKSEGRLVKRINGRGDEWRRAWVCLHDRFYTHTHTHTHTLIGSLWRNRMYGCIFAQANVLILPRSKSIHFTFHSSSFIFNTIPKCTSSQLEQRSQARILTRVRLMILINRASGFNKQLISSFISGLTDASII